ncbi:hypothetical protein GW17_00003986 [Ensete ventricosum]|nr:hypothetical protein GW17_00003986 [Ensete ventricosum]
MGGSGKWLKSFVGLKKQEKDDNVITPTHFVSLSGPFFFLYVCVCVWLKEKSGGGNDNGKSRKWKKLWRSSSGEHLSLWRSSKGGSHRSVASEASDVSSLADAFTAAVATVVRAPPKDFKVVSQEWAAIRIQTAFRAFLALVRVQARIRARRVRMSTEGQAVQRMLEAHRSKQDLLKEAEMRQEGALKRERAIAYAMSQQVHMQFKLTVKERLNQTSSSLKLYDLDKNNGNWSWLERWMAAKPWENRLMEEKAQNDHSQAQSKSCEDMHGISSEPASVKIKKNNMSTRISAKPPTTPFNPSCRTHSTSSPPTELHYNESSASSSSICTSTPLPSSIVSAAENSEGSHRSSPSYMNLTESIKAKQKTCSTQTTIQLQRKALSHTNTRSNLCPNHSAFSSKMVTARDKRSMDKENYSCDEQHNYVN